MSHAKYPITFLPQPRRHGLRCRHGRRRGGGPGPDGSPTVPMTRDAMEAVAKIHGDVAEAALGCGFDMLLIHGGHGLALSQFCSPILNCRDDNGTENIAHPTEFLPQGCDAKWASAVKASPEIHIPVLTLGAFQDPAAIEEAMARGLLCDAQRPNKAMDGLEDEIIPCIKCFHCLDHGRGPTFCCSVDPTVGRELELSHLIPPRPGPNGWWWVAPPD